MTKRREFSPKVKGQAFDQRMAFLDAKCAQRFRRYVDVRQPGECWPWTGQRDRNGYGRFSVQRGVRLTQLAHRHAYQFEHGIFIPDGFVVCHACDTPWCVNPAHLWVGIQADNVADMDAKGRRRWKPRLGEKVNTAKLTKNDVLAIRASDESGPVLARRYGVSKEQIGNIRRRRQGRHV